MGDPPPGSLCREGAPSRLKRRGHRYCVPISELARYIGRTKQDIEMLGLVGHVSEGNFHLSILVDADCAADMLRARDLAASVNPVALSLGRTVTGEHGIGVDKKKCMLSEHGGLMN